jgi:hypothetical protein
MKSQRSTLELLSKMSARQLTSGHPALAEADDQNVRTWKCCQKRRPEMEHTCPFRRRSNCVCFSIGNAATHDKADSSILAVGRIGKCRGPRNLQNHSLVWVRNGRQGVVHMFTKGTAKATIAPDKICETLAPLDSALLTPRALWEFQRFRLQYRCPFLGKRPDAYSEFP